jgi:FdhE protein
LFSTRAARLRKLSEGHAVADYLQLMATLSDAQQVALDRVLGDRAARGANPEQNALELEPRIMQAKAYGMPLLQAVAESRDPSWLSILRQLCNRIAATQGFPDGVASACLQIQQLPARTLEELADLLLVASTGGFPASTPDSGIDARVAPFIMAALQVHWVRLVCSLNFATVAEHVGSIDVSGVCPVCGTAPVASVVRAEKAYQGYRYLQCALCATEWHMVRIKCSHCQGTEGIHYHSIEGGSSALRAEACDRCHTYRKICYQEHDMDVEPLADDLGSLALDLLMAEQGFHRGSGNPLLWQGA